MKKTVRIIVLVIVALVAVFASIPAYATALPDSTPSADFYVYRNLLETGDWLMLIYYNIPYAVVPAEPVNETFMFRLLAADNVTELGTVTPYVWNDNGYGYGVASMYWDAGNVTANGMVWNTAYTMRLNGNPVNFVTPPVYNFVLTSSDYTVFTLEVDVQADLAARILTFAAELDTRWGLGAVYSLLNETETGTVLSVYGEAYFRGAIYGLQGLCPQVFQFVISDIDLTPRTWTNTYVISLQNQYTGTWADTAKHAGAALFGTTFDLTAMLISILVAAALAIMTIIFSGDIWHGLCDARTGLIVMTRLGFLDLGFLGLLAALAVIYGAIRAWGVLK
jgi:hypothetical protein